MEIEFNDLLGKCGIDPGSVLVMRHRPTEKDLRDALPGLAAERMDVYNAYQSIHGEAVEGSLCKKAWLASFIGHKPRKALFVGLFKVSGYKRITIDEYHRKPANKVLTRLGSRPPGISATPLWFDLRLSKSLAAYGGRLVIGWPGIERSWWRRAERNVFPVEAIAEEGLLVPKLPEASSLVISWAQLGVLPSSWASAISQWRGIYYIFDRSSGKGYVGSACGGENILGRWRNYAATGHGGNKLLRRCKQEDLQFSVLQLTATDADPRDVVELEGRWKERLHTRSPLGLNSN